MEQFKDLVKSVADKHGLNKEAKQSVLVNDPFRTMSFYFFIHYVLLAAGQHKNYTAYFSVTSAAICAHSQRR